MQDEIINNKIDTCDECGSGYFTDTSLMSNLCPECSHILYGYKNCEHEFENGKCIKCFWNGNVSVYIKKLKDKNLNKSKRIINIVEFLQDKYGEINIVIRDHWESDKEAIGLTDKTGQYLAYISTVTDKDNEYFLSLENPPAGNEKPYSPVGDYNNISLTELENILTRHLGIGI
jgi:predicted RNA-binding Zn-ribbon protein involved in translation (DUF1610 family)